MIRRHSRHVNIQCPLPVQAKIYVIGVVGEGQLRFIPGSCETLSLRGPPEALSASSLGFPGFPRARGMASQSVCCRDLFLTEHCSALKFILTVSQQPCVNSCVLGQLKEGIYVLIQPHTVLQKPLLSEDRITEGFEPGALRLQSLGHMPPRSHLHLSEQHSEALWSGCRPRPQICFFPEGRDVSHPRTS